MALVTALPALALALALGGGHPPLQVIGRLLLAVIGGTGLALLLAKRITRSLAALERALRSFDPEADTAALEAPAGAPREVAVLFERLSALSAGLRGTLQGLQAARQRDATLQHDLVTVIGARDRELKGRGDALQEAQLALERQLRTDTLTGTANRRGCTEFLERAWRTAQRGQHPLSILMVDIDHLDDYETSRGRERTDACIQAVANALQHLIGRATDLVAHHGNGRFVLVLGNTPLEGALRVGEQLRATIEALAIPHPQAPGTGVVTISVGATSTLPPRGSRAEGSLSAAEHALETAIGLGRNQVAYSAAARTGLFQSLCLPNDPPARLS